MPQFARFDRLFEAMRQTLLRADHAVVEDLLRLVGEPVRLGFDQPAGL